MSIPTWFAAALAQQPERRDVVVAGARIAYRAWGSTGSPGVVLVHGGAAHSGWWDHVAPLLTGHRVVALDLTGHGDSDRRAEYDPLLWAREVVAVAAHAAEVGSVVVIDSPLNDQPPDEERLRARRRPHRVYPTQDEAVGHFRTLPPQDVVLPFVRDHVARGSLRPVEGGWTWKFDPDFFGTRLRLRDLLPAVAAPLTLLRCEHGLVPAAMAIEMAGLTRGPLPVVELPATGHHPMLDQPLALVAVLRTLLAGGARDTR
jgi:pimeloyl-ACP methyl ester carboxylesterase